jgi:hypothetical protein
MEADDVWSHVVDRLAVDRLVVGRAVVVVDDMLAVVVAVGTDWAVVEMCPAKQFETASQNHKRTDFHIIDNHLTPLPPHKRSQTTVGVHRGILNRLEEEIRGGSSFEDIYAFRFLCQECAVEAHPGLGVASVE